MPKHVGFSSRIHQKGQALLIVVLVMVIALTVGLSVASRSITTLRTSLEEANSQKAFSAAEAGVENAIKSGQSVNTAQSLGNNATISQVSITTLSGNQFLPNNGNPIPKDEGVDLWLSNYPDYGSKLSGTVNIYWGNASNKCNDAALEIILISGSSIANPTITRYAVDPDSCSGRRASNHFSTPGNGTTINGHAFNNSASLTVSNGITARIIPLYISTPVGVSADFSFPSQGKIITSIGASGGTQRKIQFYQGYDELPSELYYSLFSL